MSPRLIDLTHVIQPTNRSAERKFVVNIHNALHEIPGKVRPPGEWYVMSDVELMNHVGTHIETPFHCLKEGADLSKISLDQLVGAAVILDLRDAVAEGGVTLAQVQAAATKAGVLPDLAATTTAPVLPGGSSSSSSSNSSSSTSSSKAGLS